MRRYAAEFLGTFLLAFAGPGAVIVEEISGGGVTSLGVGLSFGLAVMTAIYAVGHLSGAHQPCRHSRLRPESPLSLVPRSGLPARPANRSLRRQRGTPSPLWQRWTSWGHGTVRLCVLGARVRDHPHPVLDVRHLGGRHRCPGRRTGSSYSHRRVRGACCYLRGTHRWCLYEPSTVFWFCTPQWNLDS